MVLTPRPRVLCVDDDEDSRVMLTTLLGLARIEAIAVGTAALAWSSIRTERFDACLLDSRLPDLDGFELCRRIRDFDPHTPILFFSGAGFKSDEKKGIEAGANAYVIKPEIDKMLELVKRFVSHADSAVAAVLVPAELESTTSRPLACEIARAANVGYEKR